MAVAGLILVAVSTGYGIRMYYRDAPTSPALRPPAQAASMMPPWWIIALLVLGVLLLVTAWIRTRKQPVIGPRPLVKTKGGNGRQTADLRDKAEDLARRLCDFVETQRNRRPNLEEQLLPQISPADRPVVRFDPWPHARREYEVQYADKVAEIYTGFFAGSQLAIPASGVFIAALSRYTGKPAMPTTFNEIIAIALELELKAAKLPRE